MTNSRTVSSDDRTSLLDCLKAFQEGSGSVDIAVRHAARTGLVQVRGGRAVAAEWGRLTGNGAFLSLIALPESVYTVTESTTKIAGTVTVSLIAAERLVKALPHPPGMDTGDEEEKLQRAIGLFHQFRRQEAGAVLVEILRANCFYYPAWLWHSRLMTREENIRKALNQAKKWGNCDPDIQLEAARIETRLDGSATAVKRCIFCWSVVRQTDDRCAHCRGMFQIAGGAAPPTGESPELEKAIAAYERELRFHPGNPRIAYCLCLAFYSLGKLDRAREYVDHAQKISPREPLFIKTKALLGSSAGRITPSPRPPAPAPVILAPPPVPSRVESSGKTILVVEDSQTSRKVITMLLGKKGYSIQEAKNGAEALERLAEQAPDLVLLDLMLPDISGYEILAKIRQGGKTADIPVVMLTGKSNPADRMKGLHHGSNEYLTKPFDPAKLLAVLEKYIDQPVAKPKETQAAPPKVVLKTVPPAPKARIAPAPAAPTAAKAAPVAPTGPAASPGRGGKQKSILVVEDSPTSRKVISMVIAKRGYTVNEAATGAVALRKSQEGVPDLVLLDAMLPDMTGYEILHRFKSDLRLKDVPVVMLTAKNNPVDRQKGLQGGSSAYITKPFDPEKLLAVIDEYIR